MKNSVFDWTLYQDFILHRIKSSANRGRGMLRKLSTHVGIHTSTLSQILAHKKHFTLEQACLVADFFGLGELESRYFLLLVSKERAGTPLYRNKLQTQLNELKKQSDDLATTLPQDRALSIDEKAIFYSNWYYAAIWAQTSIPGFGTRDALATHFNLPHKTINEVVSFLLQTGLCITEKEILQPGPRYVHLEASSPLIARHHANWRMKAMERHPTLKADDLCYSVPMTLSKKDGRRIRDLASDFILELNKIRDPSPSEALYIFNIDWIKL